MLSVQPNPLPERRRCSSVPAIIVTVQLSTYMMAIRDGSIARRRNFSLSYTRPTATVTYYFETAQTSDTWCRYSDLAVVTVSSQFNLNVIKRNKYFKVIIMFQLN